MNVIPLSRLDIYEFQCDTSLIDSVNEDIAKTNIEWKKLGSDGNENYENLNTLSSGYLNQADAIPYYHYDLFDWLNECVNEVSTLHFNSIKLSIVDSWLTKSQVSQTLQYHRHIPSVISGVLYLSSFAKSRTFFRYTDPWTEHLSNLFVPEIKTIRLYPEKGKLILWRSDISHAVEPHSDIKSVRQTLAFNTFIDGNINTMNTARLSLKVDSVKDKYEAYMNKKNNETM